MGKPSLSSENSEAADRFEVCFAVHDRYGRALVDVTIADEDMLRAVGRAIGLARLAHADMASQQQREEVRRVSLTDPRAGMEPDQPLRKVLVTPEERPAPMEKPYTPNRVALRVFGDAGTNGDGSSGSVALRTEEEPRTLAMENCVLAQTHGPHNWRKPETGRPVGPLVRCPGVETVLWNDRSAAPHLPQAERQCDVDTPHSRHLHGEDDELLCKGIAAEAP